MNRTINWLDWYYGVPEQSSAVWSTKRIMYVGVGDADYITWTHNNGQAQQLPSSLILVGQLTRYWQPLYFSTNGVAIVSTVTPALNGTYGLSTDNFTNILGVSAGIGARNRVPGGGSTFQYPDITGNPHDFTAANFLDFASAIEDYIYFFGQAVASLVLGVSGPALPTTPLQIA